MSGRRAVRYAVRLGESSTRSVPPTPDRPNVGRRVHARAACHSSPRTAIGTCSKGLAHAIPRRRTHLLDDGHAGRGDRSRRPQANRCGSRESVRQQRRPSHPLSSPRSRQPCALVLRAHRPSRSTATPGIASRLRIVWRRRHTGSFVRHDEVLPVAAPRRSAAGMLSMSTHCSSDPHSSSMTTTRTVTVASSWQRRAAGRSDRPRAPATEHKCAGKMVQIEPSDYD